jgi:PAS domain S-box-containing protein/putative nucleotidyltransferase with HDIG domain
MARVLIVDDEQSIRSSLGAFAEQDGHDVSLASVVAEALDLLGKESFDIVVTDIIMPRRSGIDLLADIRQAHPDVQVIMVTGEPEVGTAAEAVRKGAFDYLSKPVSRDAFSRVLTAAVAKKVLIDENRELTEDNRRYREHLERQVEIRTEQIRNTARRYETLFNSIADPVFVFDSETSLFLDCNAIALDRYGYTMDELLAMTPHDLHPSEEKELVSSNIADNGDFSAKYYMHITKNGEQFPVEVHTRPLEFQGKEAWISIVRDISERKRAEEELRASEAQLSSALRMAHAGHWEYDVQSDTFTFNDNFYRIFRTTAGEVGGYTMSSAEYARRFCHPDDRHMVSVETQAAIETDDPYYGRELEHRILFANGDVGHIAVRLFVVKDSRGRTVKTYGVNQDITERLEAEQRIRSALEGTIQAVAETIEIRDPYTAGHQKRVTSLAVAIAQHLNLPEEQVEGIRVAATLHDIGKMSTPAEILSKPGKLSENEFLLIREHPKVAHAILKDIALPWPVAEIVLQHHERLDGTGYPRGLEGGDILLEARIIAVADTVEAMSSHRPYRPALGIEEALREIEQNKGTRYDPDAVTACVALFETGEFSLDS